MNFNGKSNTVESADLASLYDQITLPATSLQTAALALLSIPASQFNRLRSNPFFPYIEQRLINLTGPPPAPGGPAPAE